MKSGARAPGQEDPVSIPTTDAPRVPLDVRPVLAEGGEPYRLIMDTVEALAPGEVLALRTPFDPAPLHRVLGGLGFERATRELGPGDFETEYRRTGDLPPRELDVRGLQPPEPMERTLAVLDEMPGGQALVQVNDRVPAFLLPLLDERGLRYRIGADARGTITTIWRPAARS
jgi:uncharacterized protein (DUF2249 family)